MAISTRAAVPATGGLVRSWRAPLLLAVAAALLYTIGLDRLPNPDELHHAFAARGLLATGEPSIAEGRYDRVLLYSWLVAGAYALLGDSLWAARVPALLCTVAADVVLFCWLRRRAGGTAAWVGAGLFAVSPFAVSIAQFSRFYGPQVLAFTLACTLAYRAVIDPLEVRRRAVTAAGAAAALLLAVYLQPTTLIGTVGLGGWVAVVIGMRWLEDGRRPRALRLGAVAAVLVAGAVLLAAAAATGMLGELVERYRSTAMFNRGTEDQFWFYHAWFSLLYPTLWPLTGIVTVAALAAAPRPAAFALAVFATGFLLSSFAAAKNLRYFAYALPFLFAIWGIGVAALWPRLRALVSGLTADLRRAFGLAAAWPAALLVGLALVWLALANPFWLRTATLLAEIAVPPEVPSPDWPRARPVLQPLVDAAGIVVSTEELATLYFLGRYDVRFSPSKMEELTPDQQREFGRDHRTGRAVIATRASLERLMACFATGLIVGPADDWGKPHKINQDLGAFIRAHAAEVTLPPGSHLFAYRWERPALTLPAAQAGCDELAGLPRPRPGLPSGGS